VRTTTLLLTLLLASSAAAADLPVDAVRPLVVQHDGRLKPFDTFARESVRRIFGTRRFEGRDPVATALSILADPAAWRDRKLFPVESEEIANRLFEGRREASAAEILAAEGSLLALLRQARALRQFVMMRRGDVADEFRVRADEIIALAETAEPLVARSRALRGLFGELRIAPGPGVEWLNLRDHEGHDHPELEPVQSAWEALAAAFRAEDGEAFEASAAELLRAQRGVRPSALPSRGVIRLEVVYNAIPVLSVGAGLFALILGLYVLHAFVGGGGTRALATGGLGLGLLYNTALVVVVTIVAGRLPLRNLNEVALVVLWSVPALVLLMQGLLRHPIYGGIGAGLTLLGYIGTHFFEPTGWFIRPLVAILDSGWREIHILSIMLSYGVLFLSWGIHLVYGFRRLVEGPENPPSEAARELDRQAYHVLAWGFLLLTIGIATGAAWAHASWGRYWGWDPKEVWATIAWGIYALFLHLRLFRGWRGGWLILVNTLGYAAILFTYFGVTYLLSGLHAYGRG
jgi:cytochrome c-type biogenesis protein CcsB